MQTFKINKNTIVVCNAKNTRNGFKHTATLIIDGREVDQTKICYLNRTWEAYEYESVLHKILEKNKIKFNTDKFANRPDSGFEAVKAVMALGQVLIPEADLKARNDWDTRMLRAGLESRGLIMPDDWDSIPEVEKAERLSKIKEIL